MKLHTFTVDLSDLMSCIFHALELISPSFAQHHNRVAYICQRICESLGLGEEENLNIALAASLHDIGAISLEKSIEDLRFETDHIHEHSIVGSLFLEHFPPLIDLAPLLKYHHVHYANWQSTTGQPEGETRGKTQIPLGSFIIYLADRVSIIRAAFHHERLDGTGYPFRIPGSSLPLGSQIMAVADIFSALNEERSYRPAMEKDNILQIMYKMVRGKAINGDLVRLLEKNYDEVNKIRRTGQEKSAREYAAMNPFLYKSRFYRISDKPLFRKFKVKFLFVP